MFDKQWGDIIQLAGMMMVTIGIGIEFLYQANIGFLLITIGSLAFAIGTKIKHRKEG